MSNRKSILIIGRHAEMLARVRALLEEHGYKTGGAQSNEEAMAVFTSESFDGVIIGGGVDAQSRNFFRSEFLKMNPAVKIIDAHPQTVLAELSKAFAG